MGNDGGVIAVQRKFMRHGNVRARAEAVDGEERRRERAESCALSGAPLRAPVVACALGNLFNKQALLEALLARALPPKFAHISSLKDVVGCRFSQDERGARFCPVTMLELNGKHPFVVMRGCGCVLSERAVRQVQSRECLVCGAQVKQGEEPIALLQPEGEYEQRQRAILERKAEEKRARKDKKSRKKEAGDAAGDELQRGHGDDKKKAKKSRKRAADAQDAGVNVPSAKIAKSATEAILKSKEKSQVFASLFSKGNKDEKKSANDLLMTVGGLRYTLS